MPTSTAQNVQRNIKLTTLNSIHRGKTIERDMGRHSQSFSTDLFWRPNRLWHCLPLPIFLGNRSDSCRTLGNADCNAARPEGFSRQIHNQGSFHDNDWPAHGGSRLVSPVDSLKGWAVGISRIALHPGSDNLG